MKEGNQAMKTVYVVAWQYNTGAGFDWYHTPEAADKAFAEEKFNVKARADGNWTAYRFDYNTTATDSLAVTDEIDAELDALCQSATEQFGPGFAAMPDKSARLAM